MNIIDGDLKVKGALVPESISYPASGIKNANLAPDANLDPLKMQHQHVAHCRQATGADVADKTEDVYTAYAAGELVGATVYIGTAPTGTSIGTDKKFTV